MDQNKKKKKTSLKCQISTGVRTKRSIIKNYK